MKALVTGGAGFIGSHIVDRLINDGHEVIVLDDFSTGKMENLPVNDQKLLVVEGDIRDFGLLQDVMNGVDWVFHHAAVASVPKTVHDPLGSSAINYTGTLNILESARINKIKRVVFASSAALYGDEPTLPKVETMFPVALSPYAVDKLASEYACMMYHKLYGLESVALRYFNVYGPRQDPSSPYSGVISIFIDCLKSDSNPAIYGDGEQTRDFIYVSDVVEANMKAILTKGAEGEVYNIATGEHETLNELLKILCDISGRNFYPDYKGVRDGDKKDSYANVSKAKNTMGFSSTVQLKNGLKRLFAEE